jgi:hypothetical protein
MVIDQGDDGAYALFLLGGIAFGVDGFLVLFSLCLVRCYKELDTVAKLSFLNSSFFFGCVHLYGH